MVAALSVALLSFASANPADAAHRRSDRYYVDPFLPLAPPFTPYVSPPGIRPQRFGPYRLPAAPGGGAPAGPFLALPQGASLTISAAASGSPQRLVRLNRLRDVGAALAACWHPPASPGGTRDVTLRVGFNRSGGLIGTPRITYSHPAAATDVQKAFTGSVLKALGRCAPLPFTVGLGSAIAGQPFSIRFTDERQSPSPSQGIP